MSDAYSRLQAKRRNAIRAAEVCTAAAPGWQCWFSAKHPVHPQTETVYQWVVDYNSEASNGT